MAIVIKEKENGLNWFAIAVGMFAILFFGLSAYFLFFSPVPLIQKFAPVDLQGIQDVAKNRELPSNVLDDTSFRSLRQYVPNPDPGVLGRSNPFSTF